MTQAHLGSSQKCGLFVFFLFVYDCQLQQQVHPQQRVLDSEEKLAVSVYVTKSIRCAFAMFYCKNSFNLFFFFHCFFLYCHSTFVIHNPIVKPQTLLALLWCALPALYNDGYDVIFPVSIITRLGLFRVCFRKLPLLVGCSVSNSKVTFEIVKVSFCLSINLSFLV